MRHCAVNPWIRPGAFAGLVLLVAQAAAAQTTCAGTEPVGWIGITRLICSNCEYSYPRAGQNRFATEPRVAGIAANTPAASAIRAGDVLVGIDGHLITTSAAGQRLSSLKPGEAVWVEVRRNGEVLRFRFANLPAICPSAAPVIAQARAGGVGAGPVGAGVMTRTGQVNSAAGTFAVAGLLPRASFGFGIACSRCSAQQNEDGFVAWEFHEFPEIYSVDAQSQAYRAGLRRGDVITRIDDLDITSTDGGRRFGQVQPGQTVRLTLRRGSVALTRSLTAEAPRRVDYRGQQAGVARYVAAPDLTEARELIEKMRTEELRSRAQLNQLRRHDERTTRELAELLLRQQDDQTRRLTALYEELERLDRASTGQARLSQLASTVRERNIIRYAGQVGNAEVEVRGPAVNIVETADEVIITSGETTIRIRRSGR